MYQKYQDLATVRTFLDFDCNNQPSDRRLKVCVASLLYRIASSDQSVVKDEMQEIITLLDSEFHLMDDEAMELVQIAGFMQRESASKNQELQQLDHFLKEVNERLDRGQRQHLLDMIWRVAEADKFVRQIESEFFSFLRRSFAVD